MGELLAEFTSTQGLLGLSPSTYTFKSTNGGSVIDLAFVTPVISKSYHSSSVDQNVELFSGAPFRGHFPVIHQFIRSNKSCAQSSNLMYYKDFKNTDWDNWRADIECEMKKIEIAQKDMDSSSLWEMFRCSLTKVNDKDIPLKRISTHSKPFWTNQLTELSKVLQYTKRNWDYNSTPSNKAKLEETKTMFSDELIKTKNCWIRNKLENLNTTDSKIFWKNYKRAIIGDCRESLGNLIENGVLHTATNAKEDILFKAFFSGTHMEQAHFDKNFDKDIIETFYDHIFSVKQTFSNASENNAFPKHNAKQAKCPITPGLSDSLNMEVSIEEVFESIKHQKSSVKSFDCDNFHPQMLKNLPHSAVKILQICFNRALDDGKWLWNLSNVVFMKKEGKPNYMKAGAYRPISISSYVGKLFERIIEKRMRNHCDLEGILDDEQEGFRSSRNTNRYLYKLIANLKEAHRKNFTAFLLCIDFQKAFDSIWLKGLTVKLYKWNIQGKFLDLINSFLFSRKVRLIINKNLGKERQCGNFGVPQGSVLSPLLFIMFISDMLDLRKSPLNISDLCKDHCNVYKYADDGSILIIHQDPMVCNRLAQEFCDHISFWCTKWKLVINCDKDKTECLIIKPKIHIAQWPSDDFKELQITDKTVNFAKSTRVLGIDIDDDLNFNTHSVRLLKRCWYAWYKINRGTNRHWGLNISSLTILFKSVVIPKLLYCAPIWLNDKNQLVFKKFYAKVCLKISGSTHYSPQGITLLAMGIEPLSLLYKVVCIKFVLKALSSNDNISGLVCQIEESRGHPFHPHIIMVKDYLASKSEELNKILNERQTHTSSSLAQLETCHFFYRKCDMDRQKLLLWNRYLIYEADHKSRTLMNPDGIISNLEHGFLVHNIELHKTLFPKQAKRSTDTKVMSLIHGHDLGFNSFRYSVKLSSNPYCLLCDKEKDNNFHQLLKCPRYNCIFRDPLQNLPPTTNVAQLILAQDNTNHLVSFRNIAQIIVT